MKISVDVPANLIEDIYMMKNEKKSRGRKKSGTSKKDMSCNQFLDMNAWISMYEKTKKLPCNKILCSQCRKVYTSMFGDNLKRTVLKYGSIVALLDSFVCRDCRKASAPAKVKKDVEAKKPKKEKKVLSVEELEDRKEAVRASIPVFNPDAKPIRVDLKDPEAVKEWTTGACQRPDIFLDAGCKYCPLSKHCASSVKDMSRDILNEGRSSTRRRKVA